MCFHLMYELPEPVSHELDHELPTLTSEEKKILKHQIRKNSQTVHEFVMRLDLLVNKERYPKNEDFIRKIRDQLEILMAENDTFRQVLWRHEQNHIPALRKSA